LRVFGRTNQKTVILMLHRNEDYSGDATKPAWPRAIIGGNGKPRTMRTFFNARTRRRKEIQPRMEAVEVSTLSVPPIFHGGMF